MLYLYCICIVARLGGKIAKSAHSIGNAQRCQMAIKRDERIHTSSKIGSMGNPQPTNQHTISQTTNNQPNNQQQNNNQQPACQSTSGTTTSLPTTNQQLLLLLSLLQLQVLFGTAVVLGNWSIDSSESESEPVTVGRPSCQHLTSEKAED